MRCFGRTGLFAATVRGFAFTAWRAVDSAAALAALRFFTAVFIAGLDAFCLAIVFLPDLCRARRTGPIFGADYPVPGEAAIAEPSRAQPRGGPIGRSLSEAVVAEGRRLVSALPLN